MVKIVLFGTGRELPKYIGYLKNLGIEPYCLADNDKGKWGTVIDGMKVIPPMELKDMDCKILISCNFVNEITSQLVEMGIRDKILSYQPLFKQSVDEYADYYKKSALLPIGKEKSILIDAFDGIGWGGMEMWSYRVAEGLSEAGYKVTVYGSDWQVRQNEQTEAKIVRFELLRDDFWKTVDSILKDMEQRLPFVLVNNWTEHVFAAAYILKKKYPDQVKIISVVHNDWDALYEKQMVWYECEDAILGVSRRIKEKLLGKCNIVNSKVFYKENFIENHEPFKPKFRTEGKPLAIAWGARLEILQKRADLLPQLMDQFERLHINYQFNIAGDGPCLEEICRYVQENKLDDRIHILGEVKAEDMGDFWKKQHIYVNISEFEGCSLAMLEAMSYGAVPVVTDVSGTDEFVEDGETGCKVEVGSLDRIAEKVMYLYQNEDVRLQMAEKAIDLVREKSDYSSYIQYMEGLVEGR